MTVVQAAPAPDVQQPTIRLSTKITKSLAVSVMTTALSLSVLGILTFLEIVPAAWANVIATIAGIGPSYALNRRWVWRRSGRSSLTNEVAPFWSLCLFALVASTWTVALAARWAHSEGFGDVTRTGIVLLTNLVTFAVLWVLQFLILDRLLFPSRSEFRT